MHGTALPMGGLTTVSATWRARTDTATGGVLQLDGELRPYRRCGRHSGGTPPHPNNFPRFPCLTQVHLREVIRCAHAA